MRSIKWETKIILISSRNIMMGDEWNLFGGILKQILFFLSDLLGGILK